MWMTTLLGSLLAGCGGEVGVNGEDAQSWESASVSEALPTEGELIPVVSDSGQPEDKRLQAAYLSCPAVSMSWSQFQPSWNGNADTAGTYLCYGTLPASPHGYIVAASLSNSGERTGSAQYTCSNGTWMPRTGATCNGKVINTLTASGYATTCSSTDPVRSKLISWYLADVKRCPDVEGLNWWADQYNNNTHCLASTNYNGYGNKDTCWRWQMRNAANANGNSYNEAQATGHISAWDEDVICGALGYPWLNVSSFGTSCKYLP